MVQKKVINFAVVQNLMNGIQLPTMGWNWGVGKFWLAGDFVLRNFRIGHLFVISMDKDMMLGVKICTLFFVFFKVVKI